MGTINYTSKAFVNGVDLESDDVIGVKKIQLTDIPVVGSLVIEQKNTDYEEMVYIGPQPTFTLPLGADITMTYAPVMVMWDDPTKTPRIIFENNKWYAKFSVRAQGTFVYNGNNYYAQSQDDVSIELILDALKDPTFLVTTFTPIITTSSGKVDKTTGIPMYTCTINGLVLNVSGKATLYLPLVTKS